MGLRDGSDCIGRLPLLRSRASWIHPRRTFAIISHPDAGKTTLTEQLLLLGGAIRLGGAGEGAGRSAARPLRLDEDRAGARHFGHHRGDDLRVRGRGLQSSRHAGPRGFFRGHLPHADGGRFGGDGDRRRQGHRKPDAQIVRGLPPARHSDHDLHQQDGPRGARSLRIDRRDRRPASARMRADELAGGIGPQFPRRVRFRDGGIRQVRSGRAADEGLERLARRCAQQTRRGRRAGAACLRAVRSCDLSRRAHDAGVLRRGAEEFRRARSASGAGSIGAQPARANRAAA